jgi:hypothetical protein
MLCVFLMKNNFKNDKILTVIYKIENVFGAPKTLKFIFLNNIIILIYMFEK